MSEGTVTPDPPPSLDLKTMGLFTLRWFLGRDLSTMLLLLNLGGGVYVARTGIPTMRSWLKEDISTLNQSHRENVNEVIESWDRHMDLTIEAFKADQERDARLLDKLIEKHAREIGPAIPNNGEFASP